MFRILPAVAAVLFAIAGQARAQDMDAFREEFRRVLHDSQFAKGFAGLVVLSDELELSTANLSWDDGFDTEVSNLAVPFQTVFDAFGEDAPGLHVEGVVGYARAKQRTDDLYGGALPEVATSIDAKWRTYGAYAGVGLQFDLTQELTLTPLVHAGISRIESEATYGGPGADFTRELLDGLALNWDGYTWSGGLGARADWVHPLGPRHTLELIGRYDLGWFGTFDVEDSAQEFSARVQTLTLRGDVVGPVGIRVFGGELFWRATLGYRHFLESDLFGTNALFQIGGALELDVEETLPLASRISLSGAFFFGEDVTGWSFGVGFSF